MAQKSPPNSTAAVVDSLKDHIVVLSHGLQGNKGHMEYISKCLAGSFPEELCILNIEANDTNGYFKNWSSTSDGVDAGGERMKKEVIRRIKKAYEHSQENKAKRESTQGSTSLDDKLPTKISFIGSSLGGLYCRYCMGKLFDEQSNRIVIPLSVDEKLQLELQHFVALASPLLSVRALVGNLFYYGMKVVFFKGSGSHLLMEDQIPVSKIEEDISVPVMLESSSEMASTSSGTKNPSRTHVPLIYLMNLPQSRYYKALKACKFRITFCSTMKDEDKVPFWSSALIPFKRYEKYVSEEIKQGKRVQMYLASDFLPTTGTSACPQNCCIYKESPLAYIQPFCTSSSGNPFQGTYYENETQNYASMLHEMTQNLRALSWIRVDIPLYHAQAAVINEKRKYIADILVHLWGGSSVLT